MQSGVKKPLRGEEKTIKNAAKNRVFWPLPEALFLGRFLRLFLSPRHCLFRRFLTLLFGCMLGLALSGLWMWWELKVTRAFGAVAFLGGVGLFALYLMML